MCPVFLLKLCVNERGGTQAVTCYTMYSVVCTDSDLCLNLWLLRLPGSSEHIVNIYFGTCSNHPDPTQVATVFLYP